MFSMLKTSSVQSARNYIRAINEIVAFFDASAKRNYALTRAMEAPPLCICETRWIKKARSLNAVRGRAP